MWDADRALGRALPWRNQKLLGRVVTLAGVLLLLAGGRLLPDVIAPELETVRGRLRDVAAAPIRPHFGPDAADAPAEVVLFHLDDAPMRFRYPLGTLGGVDPLVDRLQAGAPLELAVDRDGLEAARRAHAWYGERLATAGNAFERAEARADARIATSSGVVAPVEVYEIRGADGVLASRLASDPLRITLATFALGGGFVVLIAGLRLGDLAPAD